MTTGVAFADSQVGWVVAPGWPSIVLSTTDGGAHWQRQHFPAKQSINSVCCVDRQHVWALFAPRKVFWSSDGGQSWHKALTGLPDLLAITGGLSLTGDMQFLDARHGWMVGGQDGAFLSTTDGGHHWRLVKRLRGPRSWHGLMLGGVYFVDRLHGWVLGEATAKGHDVCFFAQTSDGGKHWRRVVMPHSLRGTSWCLNDIDSVGPDHLWAVGDRGLIMSSQRSDAP